MEVFRILKRIKNLCVQLRTRKLNGLLVSSQANIRYLTTFNSRDSYLLVTKEKIIFFTDFRYLEEAHNNLKNIAEIEKINATAFKLISDACKRLKLKRVGFEEKHLTYKEYRKLQEYARKKFRLIPTEGTVELFRQIKDKEELSKLKKAARITVEALRFIRPLLVPGKREVEVASELQRFIRRKGASSASFDIIVASGPNSSRPHHISSQRKLKNGEPVLIDLGVDYLGYKSDLTRVFFLGKINPLVKRIYNIVLEAQKRAISAIQPGSSVDTIDEVCRNYIRQAGYADFFGHSLGHGVGLEVHETPRIWNKEKVKLKPGMVFTVEPGIYLAHKFGVRIEDMVLVTSKGNSVLSGSLNK